jgi:hypothetical protein
MAKMEEFTLNTSEEFNQMIENGDIRVAKALVSTILKHLKGKKRHLPALSIYISEEQILLDVTVDRNDFEYVLKKHISQHMRNMNYMRDVQR